MQQAGARDDAGSIMIESFRAPGADFLVLCTNMMHKMAYAIESAVDIQLLHIATQRQKR